MGAIARLVQQELGATGDDLLAEVDEGAQEVLQGQHLRPTAVEGDHVAAEGILQLRIPIELVQHDIGDGVALDLDDDAHAIAVGLVAQLRDALDALLAHQFGDLFEQGALVHLIGNFGDDEGFAILADLLHLRLGAHQHRAAPGLISEPRPAPAQHDAAGGEIGSGDDLDQLIDGDLGIVHHGEDGVDHLAQIVRGYIGGHAHGDAARAIDQQIGEARRHDDRLVLLAVIVGLEVDGVEIDVLSQGDGRTRQARFGVAHGRRRIAVHGAEIALPVDERQAHGEGLRHAHQRVIDRGVAMGMVFAHDVADDARALHIGLVGRVAVLGHREEDAPMHGLEPVAHIGKRTADDHAHGVIEIAALHLVGDGDGANIGARRLLNVVVIGQGHAIPSGLKRLSLLIADSRPEGQFSALRGAKKKSYFSVA